MVHVVMAAVMARAFEVTVQPDELEGWEWRELDGQRTIHSKVMSLYWTPSGAWVYRPGQAPGCLYSFRLAKWWLGGPRSWLLRRHAEVIAERVQHYLALHDRRVADETDAAPVVDDETADAVVMQLRAHIDETRRPKASGVHVDVVEMQGRTTWHTSRRARLVGRVERVDSMFSQPWEGLSWPCHGLRVSLNKEDGTGRERDAEVLYVISTLRDFEAALEAALRADPGGGVRPMWATRCSVDGCGRAAVRSGLCIPCLDGVPVEG